MFDYSMYRYELRSTNEVSQISLFSDDTEDLLVSFEWTKKQQAEVRIEEIVILDHQENLVIKKFSVGPLADRSYEKVFILEFRGGAMHYVKRYFSTMNYLTMHHAAVINNLSPGPYEIRITDTRTGAVIEDAREASEWKHFRNG